MARLRIELTRDDKVRAIVNELAGTFRTFGGGQVTEGNPISHALRNQPLQFAACVNVREVVEAVLAMWERLEAKR